MAELKKTWNGQTCAIMMSGFLFPVRVCEGICQGLENCRSPYIAMSLEMLQALVRLCL